MKDSGGARPAPRFLHDLGQAMRRAAGHDEEERHALSTLTCPSCGARTRERMPEDRCVIAYPCPRCGHLMRPLVGDSCVFCSYGTVKCPSQQSRKSR